MSIKKSREKLSKIGRGRTVEVGRNHGGIGVNQKGGHGGKIRKTAEHMRESMNGTGDRNNLFN